jgi:hypothetical protein
LEWKQKKEYSSLSDRELQKTLEQLRQKLLDRKDIGKIKKALTDFGISVDDQLITAVKRYNFDSLGISFMADNYDCWKKLAKGKGTIRDAQYFVHEMEEVKELQKIKEKTGFDFMGLNFDQMSKREKTQWGADFEFYYKQSHIKALECEYDFLAKQVSAVINDKIKITRYLVASIDTRKEARLYMLLDEVPLEEHANFNSWRQRGRETVEIGKRARERLRISSKNPTLEELVGALKQVKLNKNLTRRDYLC